MTRFALTAMALSRSSRLWKKEPNLADPAHLLNVYTWKTRISDPIARKTGEHNPI